MEGSVLVYLNARFLIHPRQVEISSSVIDRIAGRCRRRLGGAVVIKLVAIVTWG